MAAGLVAIKVAVIFGIARAFGMATRPAFGLGLLLSQGGEFGFVLFAQAQAALLIAPEAASQFGAVVTLSMATTPFLLMLAKRFEFAPADDALPDGPDAAPDASAIVVGYGRFGQTVSQMLLAKGCSLTLIDIQPAQIERTAAFGAKVYYGDGRRIDLLRTAGAGQAQLILFCIDDRELGPKQLEPIITAFPEAKILVRAFDRRQMMTLAPLGLTASVREVYESAVLLAIEGLKALDVSDERIVEIERDYRARDLERLAAQTESGDLHAGSEAMRRLLAPELQREA
jgi:CPA2 family monovalent cation:H+ antiporter-2